MLPTGFSTLVKLRLEAYETQCQKGVFEEG